MPWRGPLGGDPLATLPGPDNPWLACAGDEVSGCENPAANWYLAGDLTDQMLVGCGKDGHKIGNGTKMIVSSLGVIAAAIAGGLAVDATLPSSTTGSAQSAMAALVGSLVAGGAIVLAGCGGATLLDGIAPKVTDYKKHVPALRMRKYSLPADLDASVPGFLVAVTEVERLSTAETDIIDHARAAARSRDRSWTELHLRDLYHVQNAKQKYLMQAAAALTRINKSFGSSFDQNRVNPEEHLRDLVNPVIEMRGVLSEAVSISNAEINSFLAMVRIPSPLSKALDEMVGDLVRRANGQPSQMIQIATEELERLNIIDYEAFGLKP